MFMSTGINNILLASEHLALSKRNRKAFFKNSCFNAFKENDKILYR